MFIVRYTDEVCCCLFPCEECGGDSTTLKDKSFKIGNPASSDSIECLWSFTEIIDSNLSMSSTAKKDVVTAKRFIEFFITTAILGDIHFKLRNVVTLHAALLHGYLVKCFQRSSGCQTLPLLQINHITKHFKNCMGQTLMTQTVHPQIFAKSERKSSHLYSQLQKYGEWLHAWLVTNQDFCIVISTTPTTLAIQSNFYICGSPIFPESHPLFELIQVRTNVTCNSPIERSYYSNKFLQYPPPPLCVHCSEKDCSVTAAYI